jgi:hypothetical protein
MRNDAWLFESCKRDLSPSRKKFDDSVRIEADSPVCAKWRIMRALFLFTALLFTGKASSGTPPQTISAGSPNATTAVLFEFQGPVSEPVWEELKNELDRNAAPAWPDRPMIWMKRQQFQKNMEYPDVVQVRLRGHCQAELTADWQFSEGPLGWVYMTKEGIQPIAYVNCDRIGQTLERELRGMSFRERQQKFARAISRVVAHELTHIFTQRAKHSSGGLERAYLSAGELTKEGSL